MPVGFAGLLIAAIFAAAMSTLSSNINSSAAVITSDFFQTVFPKSSFTSRLKVARWSGILCGLLGLGMALVLATWNIASLWDQFNTFLGLLTSGLGALFILGVFFPRVDSKAALIGVIGGLIVLVFIKNNTPFRSCSYGFRDGSKHRHCRGDELVFSQQEKITDSLGKRSVRSFRKMIY